MAITVESSRWPPDATVPSYNVVALLVTRFGSTEVGVMPAAKFVIAVCIAFASFVQLAVQQLWDSLRNRSTKREFAGSSRSIFGLAASYAASTAIALLAGPSAKNGCCFTDALELWQREQNCETIGYTVVE